LKVDRGDQKGLIYFSDGEIVHAECNGEVGKKALFSILRWREGKFDHERGMTAPQHTISQNWEHLLVEGMRQSDESYVAPGRVPESRSPAGQSVEGGETTPGESPGQAEEPSMERTVQSITGVSGCEGTMIVSETGDLIAHTAIENASKEAAVVASLGLLSHRLGEILNTGELESILLGRQKRKVILRDRPYYLEVRLKEGVRFDEITPSLRKALRHSAEKNGPQEGHDERRGASDR
jgi:predicted regulator of Ras-like GTPase activity (Roadblock/LC7/MglB family)